MTLETEETIFETLQYPHRLSMFEVIANPNKSKSQIAQISVWFVLIFCGFCTNGSFLFMVLTHSRMRKSVMCRLLVILSVTDVLILFNELLFILDPFIFKNMDEDFRQAFNTPLVVVSVWFYTLAENFSGVLFTVIAYERYYAVCHPMHHFRSSHSILTTIVPTSGAVTVLFTTLYAMVFYFGNISAIFVFYLLLFVPPLLPFIASTVFYSLVSYTLLHSRNADRGQQHQAQIAKRNSRKHAVFVLLVTTLVFFVLNTLRKVFDSLLAHSFRENDWSRPEDEQIKFINNNWHWASYMTICAVLNSTVNPIIYNMGSREYRKTFCKSFACIYCCYGDKSCSRSSVSMKENPGEIRLQVISKPNPQEQVVAELFIDDGK